MQVRPMTLDDLDWTVEVLAHRRANLAQHAPRLWRPSAHATAKHRSYLAGLIDAEGGDHVVGLRTDASLMIAVGGPHAWTVDDSWVPPDLWSVDGVALWDEVSARTSGAVRLVAPRCETPLTSFARQTDLRLEQTWWHREVSVSQPAARVATAAPVHPERSPRVGELVQAPAVYDPGGPVLLVRQPLGDAPTDTLTAALAEAGRHGCSLVVIAQADFDSIVSQGLRSSGFSPHCDFFTS